MPEEFQGMFFVGLWKLLFQKSIQTKSKRLLIKNSNQL
jgi:hypothetical protein